MKISDKVLKVLVAEKISPDELYYMLTKAAFTSVRGCNLRYFQWGFTRSGDVLLDMQRMEMVEVGGGVGKGLHRMEEEHEVCNGEGCRECGWVGSVLRVVNDATAAAMDAAV